MTNRTIEDPKFLSLLNAINHDDVIAVEQILTNGNINVNQHLRSEIETPLRFAVEKENYRIVNLLLEFGAEPEGFLMLVLRDLLEKKSDYNLTESFSKIINLLINAGIDLDFKLDTDRTLLMDASLNGALEIVELLVKGGADVNLVGRRGHYALMCAAHIQSQKVFNYLYPLTATHLIDKVIEHYPNIKSS